MCVSTRLSWSRTHRLAGAPNPAPFASALAVLSAPLMRVTANATAAASSAPTRETTAPSHAPNINPASAKSGCVGTKGTRDATATHEAIIAGPSGPEMSTKL